VPTANRAASLIGAVKRAIAQLAAAEGRLLSIRDELFGRAWQLGRLLPAIKDRVGHGKWMIAYRMAILADAPDLGSEIVDFKVFLFVSKNDRFTGEKRDSS
jgi:hypothetical protein